MTAQEATGSCRKWTALEDRWISEEYGRSTTKEIAEALHRMPQTIRKRAKELGLPALEPWSAAQDETLRKLYLSNQYTIAEIASRLGRDRNAIIKRAREFGLRRVRSSGVLRRYTPEEDEIIKQWYLDPERPVAELARHLGRSVDSVTDRALRRLGLPRRMDVLRELGRHNEQHPWRNAVAAHVAAGKDIEEEHT